MKKFNYLIPYISNVSIDVPVLRFVYFLSLPFCDIAIRLKITPTQITHLSNLSFLISIYFLFNNSPIIFGILQFLTLYFDVADGTVARATKTSSEKGAFYDQFSDSIKVALIFILVAIKFQDQNIWIISILCVSMYSLMQISLLHENIYNLKNSKNDTGLAQVEYAKKKRSFLKKAVIGTYSSIFAIYGNFFLYFIPLGMDKQYVTLTLIFISIVILRSLFLAIKSFYNRISIT